MHNLAQTKDGDWMTAWSGDTPWHGLGQSADGLMTITEALEMAHLDWEVQKRPLYTLADDGYTPLRVPDTFGVFRPDTDGALVPLTRKGKSVGRVWTPLQNVDAFSFLDDLVQDQEAKIEVAGALGNGEKVWILARMPESITIEGKDEVHQYLLISNTHDGTGSVKILETPIRVVCQNTLTMALRGSNQGVGHNIRHTGKMMDRVDQARKAMGLANKNFYEWGEMAAELYNTEMSEKDMNLFFIDTLGIKRDEEGKIHTRGMNILNQAHELLSSPTNNVGVMDGSVWQAYNVVTELVDHKLTTLKDGKKSVKRQESALFGEHSRKKQKAWKEAVAFARKVA